MHVKVKFTTGDTAEKDFSIPAPNSTSTNGYDYVYTTEDYNGTIHSEYTQMIKRAIYVNASKNIMNKTVSITFNVDDSNIYNGWVWFYNSDGNYIGMTTDKFRDFTTGDLSSIINGGNDFYTNGTDNNNVLVDEDENEITFSESYGFSDISKVIIVLSDGLQHVGSDHTYDCRSLSEKKLLTE